jgi:putative ATP-dependent endonuclease of OLD family
MYLALLSINNFRRMRSATIEFERGLNIIVGPNNIGKIAVADALRSLLAGTDAPSHHSSLGGKRHLAFERKAA